MTEHYKPLVGPVVVGATLTLTASTIIGPPTTSTTRATTVRPAATTAEPAPARAEPVRRTDRHSPLPDTRKASKKKSGLRYEATVRIASIGLARRVYRGGQATIDRDLVAHYTGWSSTFVRAGRSGVYWLAAHNYGSHGPFHTLLKVKNRAKIVIKTRSGKKYTYRVVKRMVVPRVVPVTTVWREWGPRSGPARAVLQTCTGSKRLLVHATLVTKKKN